MLDRKHNQSHFIVDKCSKEKKDEYISNLLKINYPIFNMREYIEYDYCLDIERSIKKIRKTKERTNSFFQKMFFLL